MRAVLLVVLAGCGTYAVHRAAFVPHATPLPTSGQPTYGEVDLSFGATALDPGTPQAGNPEVGIEVPRAQLAGGASIRIAGDFSIGVMHEEGLASTAVALHASQPPVQGGNVGGTGVSIAYSAPLDPKFRLGFELATVVWTIPYVEYTTCTTCDAPFTTVDHGRTDVPTVALAITPSVHLGRVTYFGGITIRNHPQTTEKLITQVPDTDGGVRAGRGNAILDAGAEIMLGAGVRASVFLSADVSQDPVDYGASFGAMLTVPLGDPVPAAPAGS